MIIVFWSYRWQHDHRNSSWLMRMVQTSSMMIYHVMNQWSNMMTMTMHLMMFLMDSVMSAMISHSMTDMVSGSGDGDMMMSGRDWCGVRMVGRSCAQGWE